MSTDGFRKGQWKVSKEKYKALEIDNCQTHSALVKSDEMNLKVVQGKVVAGSRRETQGHLAQSQADPSACARCDHAPCFSKRGVDFGAIHPKGCCDRFPNFWHGVMW